MKVAPKSNGDGVLQKDISRLCASYYPNSNLFRWHRKGKKSTFKRTIGKLMLHAGVEMKLSTNHILSQWLDRNPRQSKN